MNRIYVEGGTPKQRRLAEAVSQFCINELMPRMSTLVINIRIFDLTENDCDEDDYFYRGWCAQETKREYTIELERKLAPGTFVLALCHEMVHIRQYTSRNMLEPCLGGKVFWKGVDCSRVEYEDMPWEIEANAMQGALRRKFNKEKKQWMT